ncbi:MAG: hypothetical protein ACE5KA_08295 [Nitrososphaerales archaeon]
MKKDLFVRGIDSEVHREMTEVSGREGVPLASIVEDAVDKWLQHKKETSTRHLLLMYDDEESLKNVLSEVDRTTDDKLFKTCIGPPSHAGMKFLRKHGWFDATLSPYTRLFDRPKQYFGQVRQNIVSEAGATQASIMGFVTGDMCHERSLPEANKLETLYDNNRVVGTMCCPFLIKDVLGADMEDILALVSLHDESYILQKDKLYKFKLTEERLHKLVN